MGVDDGWVEIGDRFFVRRYAFYDQNIGVVLGRGEALVIDTRGTHVQAREILADLRALTTDPVTVVVDTHGHFDHTYGNHVFRPATIWGQAGCVPFMERTGEQRRASIAADEPEIAADIPDVVIDPPDRTFERHATIEVGGRAVELHFLGRGHTDHDAVITVPGTAVVWAGDLLENGAIPYFGDGYPLDWPATAAGLAALIDPERGVVVPGHGDHAGVELARAHIEPLAAVADLGRRVATGELTLDEAVATHPFAEFPAEHARRPIERAGAQAAGRLA
jgi:glyoxylase-like metal-dependent hydrolase (beta-lactamase superfamily II)